ncbi:MAG: SRPBCC family protein [Acidobacteria bacterium]|nr:SRPBCC family protein [Acidobacteriota bacterium]
MKKQTFIKQTEINATPAELFAWHERPDALERLTPPWEKVKVLERGNGLAVGTRVVLQMVGGPLPLRWVAEHVEYQPPHLFADVQRKGPFAYWYHRHRFEPTARGTTLMTDEIEYAMPFGQLGEWVAGWFVHKKLQRMFDHRHRVVIAAFAHD